MEQTTSDTAVQQLRRDNNLNERCKDVAGRKPKPFQALFLGLKI